MVPAVGVAVEPVVGIAMGIAVEHVVSLAVGVAAGGRRGSRCEAWRGGYRWVPWGLQREMP